MGLLNHYIELHNQSGDYVSAKYGQTNGWNGYVVGWTAVLPFTLFDEIVLSNEINWTRNDAYTGAAIWRNGLNGGLTIA